MVVQKLVRSRLTFMEKISIKDPKTQTSYKVALNNFENYCMEKYGVADYVEKLKEYDEDDIFEFLQNWINWNHAKAPRTMTNWFSRIKKYLHYRGIKLHPQDVKEELEFKRIHEEEMYPLSLDDIQTILKNMRYKHRTQFVCQASSLMRIGKMVQLKKKHLILGKDNIIVKIPPTIAKLGKGRTTFFSKETSRLLRPILRRKADDERIFGTNEDSLKSEINSGQILRRILVKTGLDMRYETNDRLMINTHSFRAYGITKISRHDPNFAKKIAGQKGYLDQYDRMTDDDKLVLYQKYESELIIDDIERERTKNKKLESEKSQLEKEIQRSKSLASDIEEMKRAQSDENARRDDALEYLMRKERERESKKD